MSLDPSPDVERWLGEQASAIRSVFNAAAEELDALGIRMLAGSTPPTPEDLQDSRGIRIVPLRFSNLQGDEPLSLALVATARRAPPRYVTAVQLSGALPLEALQKLALANPEVWKQAYLGTGLWLADGERIQPLRDLAQIRGAPGPRIHVSGVFLHCDPGWVIQRGLMVLGLLYRSALDELAGASSMAKLFARLSVHLGGYMPRFQRIVRP